MSDRHLERTLVSVARPKQARSEQTLYRILDAAEDLIQQKGLADVSIPDIVTRAGSSVGGFYARFRDKDELLRALEERFLARMAERVEELADPGRWAGAPTRAVVRRCMDELVTTCLESRQLIGAFLARAARDAEFREDGVRFRRGVSRRIGDLLLTRRGELSHPEPEVAIDLGVQLAFGLMFQNVIFGETRAAGRELRPAAIATELTRCFAAYVGLEPDAAAGTAPASESE